MKKMAGYCFFLCTLLCSSALSYNVDEEIKELKRMFGDDVPLRREISDEPHSIRREKRSLFATTCDPILGCFPNDGPWAERPIRLPPNSRSVVNTRFTLFTRTDSIGKSLVADKPTTLNIVDVMKPLKFIIHGFIESGSSKWQKPFREEFLKNEDLNIIVVNWGGLFGSKTLYTQATANTRMVAAEIAHLLRTLKRFKDLEYSNVHIIGHSLGAHIAGYVGANTTGELGRISGMDPAGPYFQGYNTVIRLDHTDAKFVDVIHTDAEPLTEMLKLEGGLGSAQQSGHVDFWPNGGKDLVGCNEDSAIETIKEEGDIYQGLRIFFVCDHVRVIDYYRESISACPFKSYECKDYSAFLDGGCSLTCSNPESCNSLGYRAYKPTTGNKMYYSVTAGEENYCAKDYKVKVEVAKDSPEAEGTIGLILHGSGGKSELFQLNEESETLKGGDTLIHVIGIPDSLGPLTGAELKWERNLAWWRIISKLCNWIGLCKSHIKIGEVTLDNELGDVKKFCGSGRVFESGQAKYLDPNGCI